MLNAPSQRGACPRACHTGGIVAPVVTPELRAYTTRFYQNLTEDFIPPFGIYHAATGTYYFSGDEASRFWGAVAATPYLGVALKEGRLAVRGFRPPPGTRVVPEGIPSGWRIRPTRGEGGVRYYDPQNPGNAVRVMPGNPASPYETSRAPYVRWQRNGQALDVNGAIVAPNSPEAHIPLSDFVFDPDLF